MKVRKVAIYVSSMVLPVMALYFTLKKESPPAPLESGTKLPALAVRSSKDGLVNLLDRSISELSTGCTYVTVVSPTCPVCAAMRNSWIRKHRQWQSRHKVAAELVWITTTSLGEGTRFVKSSSAELIPMIALERAQDFAQLRVRGTPTSFLLSDDGSLIRSVLGDVFPEDTNSIRRCSTEHLK